MIVSLIIPTLNRPKELDRLLKSLNNQTYSQVEIIIVNQGIGRDVLTTIRQYSNLTIKHFFVNFQSLTRARNFGIEKSGGEIIGFLDDDIILSSDYLDKIVYFFNNHSQALGVQGIITNFEAGHTKKVGGNRLVYKLYNLFAKIFLLNNSL